MDDYSLRAYDGYGSDHKITVFGYVLKRNYKNKQKFSTQLWLNLKYLVKLFLIKPVPGATVVLNAAEQRFTALTDANGYFKFEVNTESALGFGWHCLEVSLTGDDGVPVKTVCSNVFIPEVGEHVFVSDIDDTALLSHSNTIIRRLGLLVSKNPRRRKLFPNTARFYCKLTNHKPAGKDPHPFFYVSSSEWNLYDYLKEIFRYNQMPKGVFLLNSLKTWRSFLKTGKTGHDGKLIRIYRLMEVFNKQRFIFLGDNTQKDPAIYAAIANKMPERVKAIFIRNMHPERFDEALEILKPLEEYGIHICIFKDAAGAEAEAARIGLL